MDVMYAAARHRVVCLLWSFTFVVRRLRDLMCAGGAAVSSAVCSGLPDLPLLCYARFVPVVVHSLFVY